MKSEAFGTVLAIKTRTFGISLRTEKDVVVRVDARSMEIAGAPTTATSPADPDDPIQVGDRVVVVGTASDAVSGRFKIFVTTCPVFKMERACRLLADALHPVLKAILREFCPSCRGEDDRCTYAHATIGGSGVWSCLATTDARASRDRDEARSHYFLVRGFGPSLHRWSGRDTRAGGVTNRRTCREPEHPRFP